MRSSVSLFSLMGLVAAAKACGETTTPSDGSSPGPADAATGISPTSSTEGGSPRAEVQTYDYSCDDTCAVMVACEGVDEAACRATCQGFHEKGAYQSDYMNALASCAESEEVYCDRTQRSACLSEAASLCVEPPGTPLVLEEYCRTFYDCTDYQGDVAACVADLRRDFDDLPCLTAPAVEAFEACVRAASCNDLETVAIDALCRDVFQ